MKASNYYKYDFISPEIIYAEVKEELKSYFQTGVVDDLMFPRYTENCLDTLGKAASRILETVLSLNNYTSHLPEKFKSVRELWLTAPSGVMSYELPVSLYTQSTFINCDRSCPPYKVTLTEKTTGNVVQRFSMEYLLKPGNVHASSSCGPESPNIGVPSSVIESFDIRGNKIVTNFPAGILFMVYYADSYDDDLNQMIPDSYRIKQYIKAYLKYKCFETIFNNISDETFKQTQFKLEYYERKSDEARDMARTELRNQTFEKAIQSTKAARRRLHKFQIT